MPDVVMAQRELRGPAIRQAKRLVGAIAHDLSEDHGKNKADDKEGEDEYERDDAIWVLIAERRTNRRGDEG